MSDKIENPFAVQRHGDNVNQSVTQAEEARKIAEVQAACTVAKTFPRDPHAAAAAVLAECKRYEFAVASLYTFPRGGQTVSGPSIRLAEAIARNWGNLDFGIQELSQNEGFSEMQSYCWDLQTNVRSLKQFAVKHERHTRQGTKSLTDPRDIYELTANNGSRRLRACILAIIPADLIEAAVKQVKHTIAAGKGNVSIEERIKKLLLEFAKWKVSEADIEKYLGGPVAAMTPEKVAEFVGIYQAIKDGNKSPSDYFGAVEGSDESKAAIKAIKAAKDHVQLNTIVGSISPATLALASVSKAYQAQQAEIG